MTTGGAIENVQIDHHLDPNSPELQHPETVRRSTSARRLTASGQTGIKQPLVARFDYRQYIQSAPTCRRAQQTADSSFVDRSGDCHRVDRGEWPQGAETRSNRCDHLGRRVDLGQNHPASFDLEGWDMSSEPQSARGRVVDARVIGNVRRTSIGLASSVQPGSVAVQEKTTQTCNGEKG